MDKKFNLSKISSYFEEKFSKHGPTPNGLDWNSLESQNTRFDQITKVINSEEYYSIIDYGCGYGALFDYLSEKGHRFHYQGYDIVGKMIKEANQIHKGQENCIFTTFEKDLKQADYAVESGIFNLKLDADYNEWTDYIFQTLHQMDGLSIKGFAFNMLTKYSDHDFMKSTLYYADPCLYFDYCKKHFSRNIALLHDYGLYDFTIIVRKETGNS